MTVVKVEENPALVGENPGLDDEAEAGYVSPDDEDGDYEDDETDSDGDYEITSGVPQLKKGPWTPEEDRRLKNYVEAHGEGNWNKVQRNAGLNRCGKSCRLRWANHLRPDLKKGPFDAEEVEKIIRFHIMWGNKWAKMASHFLLQPRVLDPLSADVRAAIAFTDHMGGAITAACGLPSDAVASITLPSRSESVGHLSAAQESTMALQSTSIDWVCDWTSGWRKNGI